MLPYLQLIPLHDLSSFCTRFCLSCPDRMSLQPQKKVLHFFLGKKKKNEIKGIKWWADRYFKITGLWDFKAVTSKKLYTNMSSCLTRLLFAQCSNLSSFSFWKGFDDFEVSRRALAVVCQWRPLLERYSENVSWCIFIFHSSARLQGFALSSLCLIHENLNVTHYTSIYTTFFHHITNTKNK